MGRIGVTRDDVYAACGTLLKRGLYLTVSNVREELGTGSYTTLLPLIDSFKSEQKVATEREGIANSIPAIPQELNDQSLKFVKDIWWEAVTQAQKKIDELAKQFENDRSKFADTLKNKTEEIDQAIKDIKKLESEIETQRVENDEAVRKLSQREGEIALLKSQLKEKDVELKALLERAIGAEKKLELSVENRRNKNI